MGYYNDTEKMSISNLLMSQNKETAMDSCYDASASCEKKGTTMPKEKGPMMTEAFWAWLDAVMRDRNLKPADVSRMAGINESVLSKARKGDGTIGVDALTKIADGLDFPRVVLLRLGGWIPATESPMAMVWEVQSLWDELDEDDQDEVAAILRVKVKNARRKKETRKAG